MKILHNLLSCLFACATCCSSPGGAETVESATLAGACNTFACDLYKRLSRDEGNLFFSPFSLTTALTMAQGGARGETAAEMARVLHLPTSEIAVHSGFADWIETLTSEKSEAGPELHIANRLWGQHGFDIRPEYTQLCERHYGAVLETLDFRAAEQARATINNWVAEQTRDSIRNLLPTGVINIRTTLILTNAIYFLGDWSNPFPEAETHAEPFHLLDGTTHSVPLMHQTACFAYAENDLVQALLLPYAGEKLAMLVLLPRAILGLPELESSLTGAELERWVRHAVRRPVHTYFPRFTLDASFDLGATLAEMGMPQAFDKDTADFGGISEQQPLWISHVVHRAFVEIDEEGTEAAGATAVVMERASAGADRPKRPPIFRADHPFVFAIIDRQTRGVLFLGRLVNPQG